MTRRRKLSTVVLAAVGAVALLVPGTSVAVAAQGAVAPWNDELGDDARPGPLHYVALGDSFSSGEGAPFVDPALVDDWAAEHATPRCTALGTTGRQFCYDDLPGEKEIENGVGWIGDTGTDVARLEGTERLAAGAADGYSFGGDNCHRSTHAYGPRIWGGLDAENSDWGVTFAACSGALTSHYANGFRDEPEQVAAFGAGPADLVTLGFGGNDIGFGDVVTCVLGEAAADRGLTIGQFLDPRTSRLQDRITEIDACADEYGPGLDAALATLHDRLGTIYDEIRRDPAKLKPGGRMFAVGYPRLFPADPPDSCSLGSAASVGRDTMMWINGFADALNATIETTAAEHGIEYVDTSGIIATPGADGVRHDFCVDDDDTRWVNRLIPSDLRRSMHPTFQYHERVAETVLGCWRGSAECVAGAS